MLVFVAIAIVGFIFVAGAVIFGHGDVDHSVDHAVGGGGAGADGTISIFYTRVIATFIMGFGAAGAIARINDASYTLSSLIGAGSGIVLAALMYAILFVLIKEQATSLINTADVVGSTGQVTVPIEGGHVGEVGISFRGQYKAYTAIAEGRADIPKERTVRVMGLSGQNLVVKEV